MSFLLTDTFDDSFEYKDQIYNVDMTFDNILLLFDVFDDELLFEVEKIDLALEMLVIEYEELPTFDTFEEMNELFKYIMREFLGVDLDKQEEQKKEKQTEDSEVSNENEEDKVKFFDYKKDAEIIYASFRSVYGIDLFEQQGVLHWNKFSALLSHIDDESKFKQVIGYRTVKIPTGKHVDKDYVAHLRKMKEIYSLEEKMSDEKRRERNNQAFDMMANALKEKALKQAKIKKKANKNK